MKKQNLIALAIAALTLPTMALADDDAVLVPGNGPEPKEGVSLSELGRLTKDLEVRLDGQKLILAGLIPERCAANARFEYNDAREGKHIVMIRLAEACEKADFKVLPNESRISLSKVLGSLDLADVSGPVLLRHLQEKDAASESRRKDEALVSAKTKKNLEVKGSADIAAAARKLEQVAMEARVAEYCKEGRVGDVSALATEAAQLGLDLTLAIETSRTNQLQLIKSRLAKAKNAEQARSVLEEFQAAAERGEIGLDADALNSAYVSKRIALLRARIEDVKTDAEVRFNPVVVEITELKNELNELDPERGLYKARKADLADLYARMGDALHNRKEYEMAADMFSRGRDVDNRANARKWENAAAKSLMDAAEACVKKNPDPRKSAKCEKYAERSKQAADRAKEQLASLAEKDEAAAEEFEDFTAKYNEMYGGGPKFYQAGFGWMQPYAPSKLESMRVQSYQNWMQEQQAKQMQKMYGSYYGNMMGGGMMPGQMSGGSLY